jgi:hypothetical protein
MKVCIMLAESLNLSSMEVRNAAGDVLATLKVPDSGVVHVDVSEPLVLVPVALEAS